MANKRPENIGESDGKRGEKTTYAQRQQIITWLEIPSNFDLIEGRAQSKHLHSCIFIYAIDFCVDLIIR